MKFRQLAIKLFKRGVPILALLLLVGFVLFLMFFDSIGQTVLDRVEQSIPGNLTVKRFSPSLGGLTLNGVKWNLDSKEPILEASEIDVNLRFGQLLKGRWNHAVSEVVLHKPGLRVVVDPNGNLNLLDLLNVSSDEPAIDLSEIRMSIRLEDGWILYNDRRDAGFLYELSDWNGLFAFEDGKHLDYQMSGAPNRNEDSRLSLSGRVALNEPRALVTLGLTDLQLEPFAGFPGFGPGLTLVRGKVNGSVRASGEGDNWNDLLANLFLVGHLDLDNGAFRSPEMPAALEKMEGRVELLGSQLDVNNFQGSVLEIPFQAGGEGELGSGGQLEGWVQTPRFPLARLNPLLKEPLPIKGEAEAQVRARANQGNILLQGTLKGYDLQAEGERIAHAEADFLKTEDLIHLSRLEAETSAGLVSGEGWVFLGEEPRVLIDLEGQDADPEVVLPGLAQKADFKVKVMGSPLTPLIFGGGELKGLGPWAQGMNDAIGQFVYSGDNLLLYDGKASKGQSAVNLKMGIYDLQEQLFSGILSATGFRLEDLPGVKIDGVSGQFTGSAVVDADLSGETPKVEAQAFLERGDFRSGGLEATDTSGEFFFDGNQVVVPRLETSVLGSNFGLAGAYDLRNDAVQVVGQGKNVDLSTVGLSGQRADLAVTAQGTLGGRIGVYGLAESQLGRVALSGFQRENGEVAGVAWVQGEKDQVAVNTTVVANGSLDNLSLEYNGHLDGEGLANLGPVSLFGSALLKDSTLTIQPTIFSGLEAPSDARLYPMMTYRGVAYTFFGPLMSGPLEKVVLEESPFPRARNFILAGDANLASGELDLGFQMHAAGLEEVPLPAIAEKLPFELLGGFGNFQGRVVGNLSDPIVQANFLFPWLMLGDETDQRLALGARGRLEFAKNMLKVRNVAVSQASFDSRLSERRTQRGSRDGLIRLRGFLAADESFDLRVRTEGFSPDFFAFFAPPAIRDYVPSGRLSTKNLHLWGTLDSPSASGRVELRRGGIMLAGGPYPITSAFAELSSQNGEVRVSDLGLVAPGVKLSGALTRRANGKLSGELFADDIELDRLERFGGALAGLDGTADLLVNLSGRFPSAPIMEVGLRTNGLTWNPFSIGGKNEVISIQELVLGEFDPERENRLLSGLTIAPTDDGLFLDFEGEGFRFRRADDGLGLQLSGAVTLPSRGVDASPFKTFREMAEYFASPVGPDFGSQGEPFRLAVQNLSTSEVAALLGAQRTNMELESSFELSLLGQWWRDHQLKAGDSLPHYRLAFDDLAVASKTEGPESGFKLTTDPVLSYQREGLAGYLNIENWNLGFFREEDVENEETGTVDRKVVDQGVIEASGRLALATLAGTEPVSRLKVSGTDIPLANLAFLLPSNSGLSGLVDSLQLELEGVLPNPRLKMSGLASNLSFGPLKNMRLEGDISGMQENGAYRIVVGEEVNKGIAFTFSEADPKDHSITVDGEAILFWTRDESNISKDRLELFAKNIGVSLESPIDLTLDVIDKNLGILANMVDGKVEARGDFLGKLAVTGTLRRPEFEGRANLDDGRFISRDYGRFENLNLDARLNRITRAEATESPVLQASSSGFLTRLAIVTAEGTLGGQPFFANGTAEFAGLAPTLLDLFFVGESLPVRLPGLFSGTVDVDLEMNGEVKSEDGQPYLQPQLSGIMVIPNGTFDIPVGGSSPATAEALSQSGPQVPVDLSLDISLGKEFFVQAYDARVRALGDLNLRTEQGAARLFGRVELNRGLINIPLYDAAFRLRSGLAIFDGPFIPVLRGVEAVVDLAGYRITAQVDGRYPDTLNVELISDPPLPKSELARVAISSGLPSQQISGDPTSDTSTFGSLSSTGVNFLSGLLTSKLTREIGNFLFLSELTFDYIPPATYAVKVAKALDPNDTFLVTVTRIIRDEGLSENLFGVEWRFTRSLLVRLAFDQLSRIRFWFQSINRF